jgi:type IV secretion system protein VirB1
VSLTSQAALALALHCAPGIDPHILVAIGQRESGLDPLTIHDNTTGQSLHGEGVMVAAARLIAAGHSVDLGLMQINEANFGLLRLTARTAFDPCQSVRAAGDLIAILSRYNTGSPTAGVANRYALRVIANLDSVRGSSTPPASPAARHQSDTRRFTLADQLPSFSRK